MNTKSYDFNGIEIRSIEINKEYWFIAKDVAKALQYRDTNRMTRYIELEDLCTLKEGGKELVVISEFGIYDAILNSKRKEAKEFKKWVKEVLKTIRENAGISQYEIFRMLDKEVQKDCMAQIKEVGKMGKADFIVTNKNTNKITSDKYGIFPQLKKPEMEKYHPEMLVDRQEILKDYTTIFSVIPSHKKTFTIVSEKHLEQ
jgi:prophage antirepressor-like protein